MRLIIYIGLMALWLALCAGCVERRDRVQTSAGATAVATAPARKMGGLPPIPPITSQDSGAAIALPDPEPPMAVTHIRLTWSHARRAGESYNVYCTPDIRQPFTLLTNTTETNVLLPNRWPQEFWIVTTTNAMTRKESRRLPLSLTQ